MPDEVPSRITEDDRGIAVKRLQEAFVDGHARTRNWTSASKRFSPPRLTAT